MVHREPAESEETILEPEETILEQEDAIHEHEETKSIPNTGHFIFTHPQTKKFICGKYFDYNGKTLSCSFYDINDFKNIQEEMKISVFSFFDSFTTKTAEVIIKNIMNLTPSNTFVIMEIVEVYEEN